MPIHHVIPLKKARVKVEVQHSIFIASLAPTRSIEQARDFIREIRSEFPDANHHVPAYLIGGRNQIIDYCSDDGEPSGTAGMPVLMTLRGSGLGDVAVVVTRYFGGVLLGKGGLVKAYTNAAQTVIAITERGYPALVTDIQFIAGYDQFETLKKEIHKFDGKDISEDFEVDVTIQCSIINSRLDELLGSCANLFAGKLIYELRGVREIVFPYPQV